MMKNVSLEGIKYVEFTVQKFKSFLKWQTLVTVEFFQVNNKWKENVLD